MPVLFTLIVMIVLTSIFMRDTYIPAKFAKEIFFQEPNFVDYEVKLPDGSNPKYLHLEIPLFYHWTLSTQFIGYICFSIFAGAGFIALPWDIFVDYVHRPKPIDEGNFNDRKHLLLEYSYELREKGKKLDEDRRYVEKIRGF